MDHITKGALMSMWSEGGPIVQEPILQVLQVKQLSSAPGSDVKYRVVLSDTVNFIQSMLVTGLNHLVISGALHLNCFVKLKKYTAKTLKGRRVVICQDLEVAEFLGTCPKLGEPQQMASDSDAGAAATTATSTTASAAATTAMSSTVAPTSFYGNRPPQQAAAQSMPQAGRQTGSVGSYGATGPMSRSAAANFYTINQISPYTRTWSIKARCANKSAIRTYHNKNGEGKLFNATFIDATGEIRATGFNEQVDKFFHVLEEAKKQFSNVNNDYELMFESDT
ncbi:Replication factor A protein 1, partial [Ascosphaera acerosa]